MCTTMNWLIDLYVYLYIYIIYIYIYIWIHIYIYNHVIHTVYTLFAASLRKVWLLVVFCKSIPKVSKSKGMAGNRCAPSPEYSTPPRDPKWMAPVLPKLCRRAFNMRAWNYNTFPCSVVQKWSVSQPEFARVVNYLFQGKLKHQAFFNDQGREKHLETRSLRFVAFIAVAQSTPQ